MQRAKKSVCQEVDKMGQKEQKLIMRGYKSAEAKKKKKTWQIRGHAVPAEKWMVWYQERRADGCMRKEEGDAEEY